MKEDQKLRLEALLGIKLTKLESYFLAHVKREQEQAYRPQQGKTVRRDVYDSLQTLSDGLRMV